MTKAWTVTVGDICKVQNLNFANRVECIIEAAGENAEYHHLTLSQTSPGFYMSAVQVF